MQKNPFVSVIILNFNGKDWFPECLDSLRKLDYPQEKLEVIVGDNASTDDSVDFIRSAYPWVKVIVFDDNYGFCRSNNLCAKQARGDFLVFLNNDTFVNKDWLTELVKGMYSAPDVVSCASKILFPHLEDGRRINAAGGIIPLSGGGLYEGWMDVDDGGYDKIKETGFGCGAGVMVQKKFFLETGGFDEYYFYGVEENDLGLRAWIYGYKVLYIPTAVMYHYMGKTGYLRKFAVTPTVEFLIMRNTFYFILKNFQKRTWPLAFLVYFGRGMIKILYALFHGNWAIPRAIVQGWLQGLRDIPQALTAHKGIRIHRKRSDRALMQLKAVASLSETFRRNRAMAERTRAVVKDGWYGAKDSVKVVLNEDGQMVFRKIN